MKSKIIPVLIALFLLISLVPSSGAAMNDINDVTQSGSAAGDDFDMSEDGYVYSVDNSELMKYDYQGNQIWSVTISLGPDQAISGVGATSDKVSVGIQDTNVQGGQHYVRTYDTSGGSLIATYDDNDLGSPSDLAFSIETATEDSNGNHIFVYSDASSYGASVAAYEGTNFIKSYYGESIESVYAHNGIFAATVEVSQGDFESKFYNLTSQNQFLSTGAYSDSEVFVADNYVLDHDEDSFHAYDYNGNSEGFGTLSNADFDPHAITDNGKVLAFDGTKYGDILKSYDTNGNAIDSITFYDAPDQISGNYMIANDGDIYRLTPIVSSLNTSISGNTNSYTSTGSNQFNVNSTATFSDGSTQDVTSSVTYSYDSSIVTQVSGNTFKGVGVGTTDIQATYVDNSGNTVTNDVTVYIQKPITSAELVYPTGDSTSLTGPEDFEIATELTRQDGTTFYADNADLTYTYDSSIIEKTSQGTINTEVFAGINSGTTNIQATYSGFGGTTETTNTDTVTVSDPATVDSVDIVTPNNFTHDEGESKDLDASISYSDGSGALITTSPDLTFTSSNTTIVGVSPQSGFTTANFYGNATITMEYYDSWYGTTYSTTADITVLGDRENIDFKIKDSEIKRDEKTSMSAVMDYEDGRTKNIPVNTGDINAVPSGNETFDNVNNTVSFSESNITYTLTYNYQANGQGYADFDTVEVEPVRDFEDFNKLTPYGQVFAIFDNWGFWAMLASILGGVLVGIKLTAEAGLGVMTVMLALSWVGGLVSIFIPTTLILFEIFLFAVLDVSLTN